ncbi:MAG: hypothetical protein K0S37_3881 [Microbacterium sp.]|jgi:hypothetical protein|nr:hypothetical protein [Microbacterium sp.]
MDMTWVGQPQATLLAALVSGVIGSVIGPFILRRLRRNDAALKARRKWAKEKLVWVFGEGPQMSTDSTDYHVAALLSENPFAPTLGDMHAINPLLAEALDLKLIQPRRSALLQRWLEGWFWVLFNQRAALMPLRDKQWTSPELQRETDQSVRRYSRRFRRIEVALTRWSLGVRPTLIFWLSITFYVPLVRRRGENRGHKSNFGA